MSLVKYKHGKQQFYWLGWGTQSFHFQCIRNDQFLLVSKNLKTWNGWKLSDFFKMMREITVAWKLRKLQDYSHFHWINPRIKNSQIYDSKLFHLHSTIDLSPPHRVCRLLARFERVAVDVDQVVGGFLSCRREWLLPTLPSPFSIGFWKKKTIEDPTKGSTARSYVKSPSKSALAVTHLLHAIKWCKTLPPWEWDKTCLLLLCNYISFIGRASRPR